MRRAYGEVSARAETRNVSFRDAAFEIGIERVVEDEPHQGLLRSTDEAEGVVVKDAGGDAA